MDLDIWQETAKDNWMSEYFEEMKAAAKDHEELTKKKDFPDAAQ